jgi:hypothetical protein
MKPCLFFFLVGPLLAIDIHDDNSKRLVDSCCEIFAVAKATKVNLDSNHLSCYQVPYNIFYLDEIYQILRSTPSYGIELLFKALEKNPSIKELGVSSISIGDEGALKIAELLKTNTKLTRLFLNGTRFTEKGIEALAKSLIKNSGLSYLNLAANYNYKDGSSAVSSLAEALCRNLWLEELHLSNFYLKPVDFQVLEEALRMNFTLIGFRHAFCYDEKSQPFIEGISKIISRNQKYIPYRVRWHEIFYCLRIRVSSVPPELINLIKIAYFQSVIQ